MSTEANTIDTGFGQENLASAELASVVGFGRLCAVGVGLGWGLLGLSMASDPVLRSGNFWQQLVLEPFWFLTGRYAMLASALLGLAVVSAVDLVLRRAGANPAVASWLERVALLAFGTSALVNIQAMSIHVLYDYIDLGGNIWLLGLALWLGGINLLALRHRAWPAKLVAIGLLAAFALLLARIALYFEQIFLFLSSFLLIGLLLPIFFIGLGSKLRAG